MFGFILNIVLVIFILTYPLKNFANPEVGIVEKLGNQIPLDLVFKDESGNTVSLREIIKKPTLLMFVYYRCPGICSPLLSGVSEAVDWTDLTPGVDYQLLTISFDHTETSDKARKWKKNHLEGLEKKIDENAWKFLVGDSVSIRKLTDAVGFYFKPDGKGEYIHAGAIYSISTDGKIIRYLFGTQFNPFDFKMAILEAEKGIAMPTVNRILKFCYSFDPEGRRYVFNFTRVIGSIMLVALAIFAVILITSRKKEKREVSNVERN
ncbi:MAG: SCO family protein [Ignavibacteria bacterium]|nr:SCO family protein [Ignavibacteria bacterium]